MTTPSSYNCTGRTPSFPYSSGWTDGVEFVEAYHPGGLHPVHLQEKCQDDRYTIIHRLGHGCQSTVWLGWDSL